MGWGVQGRDGGEDGVSEKRVGLGFAEWDPRGIGGNGWSEVYRDGGTTGGGGGGRERSWGVLQGRGGGWGVGRGMGERIGVGSAGWGLGGELFLFFKFVSDTSAIVVVPSLFL